MGVRPSGETSGRVVVTVAGPRVASELFLDLLADGGLVVGGGVEASAGGGCAGLLQKRSDHQ